LVGLQRTLAEFAVTAAALTASLADIHFRKPQDPIALCHWLDWIRERSDEITSHGMVLHQMTSYLGDRAHAECMKRYRAIADAAERQETITHFDPREPEPFREPTPCTQCGGHGGSVSEGNCAHCQGTGIDPSDPASPL
jgi:hypothetical protein